jgi:hypothetical protein
MCGFGTVWVGEYGQRLKPYSSSAMLSSSQSSTNMTSSATTSFALKVDTFVAAGIPRIPKVLYVQADADSGARIYSVTVDSCLVRPSDAFRRRDSSERATKLNTFVSESRPNAKSKKLPLRGVCSQPGAELRTRETQGHGRSNISEAQSRQDWTFVSRSFRNAVVYQLWSLLQW